MVVESVALASVVVASVVLASVVGSPVGSPVLIDSLPLVSAEVAVALVLAEVESVMLAEPAVMVAPVTDALDPVAVMPLVVGSPEDDDASVSPAGSDGLPHATTMQVSKQAVRCVMGRRLQITRYHARRDPIFTQP